MDIKIVRTTTPKPKPDQKALGFGKYLSDHMFLMDYDADQGWHDPRIVPYGPIPMEPAAVALHYAQETFEGLKAAHQLQPPPVHARAASGGLQRDGKGPGAGGRRLGAF